MFECVGELITKTIRVGVPGSRSKDKDVYLSRKNIQMGSKEDIVEGRG